MIFNLVADPMIINTDYLAAIFTDPSTYIVIAEFIGMCATITGSFLFTRKSKDAILYAFYAFFIGNIAMLFMSVLTGVLSLSFQMIFFFATSIYGVYKLQSNKSIVTAMIAISLVVMATALYVLNVYPPKDLTYYRPLYEIAAAVLAVVGSFYLAYEDKRRLIAFALFFIADLLFVAVAVQNSLLFFGIQSVFFLYTSSAGFLLHKKRLSGAIISPT